MSNVKVRQNLGSANTDRMRSQAIWADSMAMVQLPQQGS
jgi:hypothetical protein